MAAIVATLLYLPLGLVVALGARVFGISFGALLTFGGAPHAGLGLLIWWLFAFVGAAIYAAWFFPWSDKVFAWPSRK